MELIKTSSNIKAPVVLIIFNRPDLTENTFAAIRQARPPQLLVIADGPRSDRPGEAEKCAAARAVLQGVDWDCQVLTNYSDINLGCRDRICSGLDWVFDTVEEAIILEDDCLPNLTFFHFCDELLDYYRHDTRVMHISGSNFGIKSQNPKQSYFFSRLAPVWGWATWRRAWRYFDVNIPIWPELKQSRDFMTIFGTREEYELRSKRWDAVYRGEIDTWDYQWHLTCLSQGSYCIMPNQNLTSNLGFRADATHTIILDDSYEILETEEATFPLIHPTWMYRDNHADDSLFKSLFTPSLLSRSIKKTRQLSNKLRQFKYEVPILKG
jgi:hypothetical protein